MASPGEIRSMANSTVYGSRRNIESARTRFRSRVNEAPRWWKDQGGAVFVENAKVTNGLLDNIVSEMGTLESKLKTLANEVQRADNARRAAAK